MTKISELRPTIVWKYFAEILNVPRPSKKEEKIIAYLEAFAKSHNLEYKKDSIGNMLIIKPATPGKEGIKTVVLQSHVDMVCEKNSNVEHDFENDPIQAYIDGDWVKAKGTTLGADNGIGIAAQLAVLSDTNLKHGKVECLFTVDEETGLTGANKLGKSFFEAKTLVNLDSEDDGEIFIGCAGGVDTLINIKLSKSSNVPDDSIAFEVLLTGLKGGHSGDDIDKGLGNSNLLLTRFLWNASKKFGIVLSDFQGGNLRNAIPREARAGFVIHSSKTSELNAYLSEYAEIIKNEYIHTEPQLHIEFKKVELPDTVLDKPSQDKLLCSLYSCPNGVIAMSQEVPELVETSTNLASVHFREGDCVEIVTSQRSSVASSKFDVSDRIRSNFYLANAEVKNTDSYPGWNPDTNSKVLKIAKETYKYLFNKEPKVRAIHAGLECGLFLEKYPELDMISIGPTLRGVHSPDERMEISTVDKFWKHLVLILENLPE